MVISLYYLLFIYFIFLAIWIIFSFIAFFHMFKFGFKNITTFLTTLIYICVSIILLTISYNYIAPIDWQINITILGNLFNNNLFFN